MFDIIVKWLDQAGYLGIFLLMLLENIFPPLPSELIMPMAGFQAATGAKSLPLVILAGYAGSFAGALFWYGIGRWVGERHLMAWSVRWGRWLVLRPGDIDKVNAWFDKHSGKAVFIGRLVPGVRTLISVPAGIFKMGLPKFVLYSSFGILVWTGLLAGAGFLLQSQYETVGRYVNWGSNAIVSVILLSYIYKVVTWRPT